MTDDEELKSLIKQLPRLNFTHELYTFNSPRRENGVIFVGSYNFSDELSNWLYKFNELNLLDKNYLANNKIITNAKYDKKTNSPIYNELTLSEIITIFTWLINSDRLCDGAIATYIESGKFEKLYKTMYERI